MQLDSATQIKSSSKNLVETPKADTIPWFLRLKASKAPRYLLAEKQILPELPQRPPPELADMLNQLSEAHGITDLNTLDLRLLNPPPAIGPNVVMLVGTARSVRHLHATADKVCRYMRTQYKWSPNVDGLLGRNQLKLIHHRKQRRGKVVSTQMGEVEEAGNSDWVCVHGGSQRLVVQLFTRTRREDMNIDGLWRGILSRDERHRIADAAREAEREWTWEKEDATAKDTVQVTEEVKNSLQRQQMVNDIRAKGHATVDVNENVQVKENAKDTAREIEEVEEIMQPQEEVINTVPTKQGVTGTVQMKEKAKDGGVLESSEAADKIQPFQTQYNVLLSVSGPRRIRQLTTSAPDFSVSVNVTNHPTFLEFVRTGDLTCYLSTLSLPTKDSSSTILQAHIDALKSPLVCPKSLTGTGFSDKSSTPFLKTFYKALASAAPDMQIKYEVELIILSNTHKPKFYPVNSLLAFLQGLRQQGMPLKAEHYYVILSHQATCSELRPSIGSDWPLAADARVAIMDSYIQDLKYYLRPEEAVDIEDRPEFRYANFLALLREPVSDARQVLINYDATVGTPLDLGLCQNPGQFTLHPKIVNGNGYSSLSLNLTYCYTIRQHHLDYLTALGLGHKWEWLWKWWKRLPLHRVVRGPEYYKLAFELVAMAANQREAIYCLRWLGPEAMTIESPPVKLKNNPDLAMAVLRVIEIADPGAKSREWADIRKFCLRVVQRS